MLGKRRKVKVQMDKWDYINLIAKQGKVLELLERYGLNNTQEVSLEQAREFYENETD